MKHHILKLAVRFLRFALQPYGWTDRPKPPPYVQNPRMTWWRWKPGHDRHIESTDIAGALRSAQDEATRAPTPHESL